MKILELKIPPILVMVIIGGMMALIFNVFQLKYVSNIYIISASVFFFLLGVIVTSLALIKFRNQDTTVDPLSPSKTNSLVVGGVYKITRNPMYLGFYLWLLSFAFYLGDVLSVLLTPLFILYMNRFQIISEERVLIEKFGQDYLDYKGKVRRWI